MNLVCLFFYLFILFAFYAEIQNGHQKWRENVFRENHQQTLEITCGSKISWKSLYLTPFEINRFLRFVQKLKMATKSGRNTIFVKKTPVHSADTLWIKNFVEIALALFPR